MKYIKIVHQCYECGGKFTHGKIHSNRKDCVEEDVAQEQTTCASVEVMEIED